MTSIKNNINGWLVIDKPYQMGSTQVVGKIKHLLHPGKIGHAGTLDPLATGVLPIALGKATRLIPFVMDDKKTYEFDIQWGTQTTSDDLDGDIVAQNNQAPTKADILKVLPDFLGKIQQVPSAFSALKVNGKRAYDLARKGEKVVLNPRTVCVYDLKLVKHTRAKSSFVARVSKGTYIRTLAHDIADKLGMLGVVVRLYRTVDGPFEIAQAVDLTADNLGQKIIPMDVVLKNLPHIAVAPEIAKRIQQGQRIKEGAFVSLPQNAPVVIICQNELIALGNIIGPVLHPTWVK